jgi:hypothetical protein
MNKSFFFCILLNILVYINILGLFIYSQIDREIEREREIVCVCNDFINWLVAHIC